MNAGVVTGFQGRVKKGNHVFSVGLFSSISILFLLLIVSCRSKEAWYLAKISPQ